VVESYRTERGPRQRVLAWLGAMMSGAAGVKPLRRRNGVCQGSLFRDTQPEWVEVRCEAGSRLAQPEVRAAPVGLELLRRLDLDRLSGRDAAPRAEEIPWPLMAIGASGNCGPLQ